MFPIYYYDLAQNCQPYGFRTKNYYHALQGIADVLGLAHGPGIERGVSCDSIQVGDDNPRRPYAKRVSKPHHIRERVTNKCVKEDINQIYRFCRISDCL